MNSKYKDGKIYKITSEQTDKFYIGSTYQTLKNRFCCHKAEFKGFGRTKRVSLCNSHMICKYADCKIELIEDYSCNNKKELEHREAYYYDLYKENIVNTNRPIRYTEKERYDQNINGRKDKAILNAKKYRKEHLEMRKVKYTCECGVSCRKEDKARHERSVKHQTYLTK